MPVVREDQDEPPAGRPDARRGRGRRGEGLAAEHLERRGYAILERNARSRHGEIDLIAFDGHTLVFAEVKTRMLRGAPAAPDPELSPLAGLRPRQRARLRRLAAAWLSDPCRWRPGARELRFDAIGVLLDERGALLRLDHLEAAW